MIQKYLGTLATIVLVLTIAASTMRFASESQTLSGKAVDETSKLEFTIDADSNHTYEIGPRLRTMLEQGITFAAEGPVRILSSSVEITPKDVSWHENRTTITSTGAGLAAHLKWDTRPDSANGEHGYIYIQFPEIPWMKGKTLTLHSGGYQKEYGDRYVLREVTTYQSGVSLSAARFLFALAVGLPVGILLHCIFWIFPLRKEKRLCMAALPPQDSQLPHTFYPNPVLEWTMWTILMGVAAFVASILAVASAYDGFISHSIVWGIYIILGLGAVIAFATAYFTGKSVLTVRVDANGISYARGRGDLQWTTAAWSDILLLTQKSRTYQGNRREWLELQFKDNRKNLNITADIEGYGTLRNFLLSEFKPS
jgi:hypothetical protein